MVRDLHRAFAVLAELSGVERFTYLASIDRRSLCLSPFQPQRFRIS